MELSSVDAGSVKHSACNGTAIPPAKFKPINLFLGLYYAMCIVPLLKEASIVNLWKQAADTADHMSKHI